MVMSLKYKTPPWKTSVSLETLTCHHRWCLEVRGSGMEQLFIQVCHDVILQHRARARFTFLRCCSSKIVLQNVRL